MRWGPPAGATLRYQDTQAGVGEWGPGVWTVTRGGKRVF